MHFMRWWLDSRTMASPGMRPAARANDHRMRYLQQLRASACVQPPCKDRTTSVAQHNARRLTTF